MRILFADDHAMLREGVRPFLEELSQNDVTVFNAESLPDAKKKAENAGKLDLILLDLKMPGMNGYNGVRDFAQSHPDVPIVILSGHYNRKDVLAALDHGVSGYIPKNISGMAMVNALRLVLAGEKFLPSEVFTENGRPEDISVLTPRKKFPPQNEVMDPGFAMLTPRESEILRLLVDGLTNKRIALELDLKEITVKIHVRNIYRKINVQNRAQAVKTTLESGWFHA